MNGGSAIDHQRFEILRADGAFALLGIQHEVDPEVPFRKANLLLLLIKPEHPAPGTDHHDLRVKCPIDEKRAQRRARLDR